MARRSSTGHGSWVYISQSSGPHVYHRVNYGNPAAGWEDYVGEHNGEHREQCLAHRKDWISLNVSITEGVPIDEAPGPAAVHSGLAPGSVVTSGDQALSQYGSTFPVWPIFCLSD